MVGKEVWSSWMARWKMVAVAERDEGVAWPRIDSPGWWLDSAKV